MDVDGCFFVLEEGMPISSQGIIVNELMYTKLQLLESPVGTCTARHTQYRHIYTSLNTMCCGQA